MTTIEKTAATIENTALSSLDREGRLLNAVLKSPTTKPGRFGFRGDIALKFQAQLADEKRPPDFSIEQVLTIAQQEVGLPVRLVELLVDPGIPVLFAITTRLQRHNPL